MLTESWQSGGCASRPRPGAQNAWGTRISAAKAHGPPPYIPLSGRRHAHNPPHWRKTGIFPQPMAWAPRHKDTRAIEEVHPWARGGRWLFQTHLAQALSLRKPLESARRGPQSGRCHGSFQGSWATVSRTPEQMPRGAHTCPEGWADTSPPPATSIAWAAERRRLPDILRCSPLP